MPETTADLGYGARFGIKDGSVVDYVAEVTSLTPPSMARDTVEATHLESPDAYKEFIAGLKETGEASITINYAPSASDALVTAFEAGKGNFRILFPSGTLALDFAGIVTGYEIGDLVATDKMSGTFTVKGTGKASFVAVP